MDLKALMPIKVNTMKKYLLMVALVLLSATGFAHQTEISSTVLAEKENNVWVLQISASLTAFQQEIKTHFSETPYKTPEEFKQIVLKHIKNNLQLRVNGNESISFNNGNVQLGHETKVVFEVSGIPSNLSTFEVTNTIFEDIHRSKNILVVLKEGFGKNNFILNDMNHYTLALQVHDKEFVEKIEQNASLLSPVILITITGLLGVGFLITYGYKKEKVGAAETH